MSENNNQVKVLPEKKHRSTRRNNIIQLVSSLLIVVALNIISSFVFTRFDLTAEKRYSISKATKKMIRELDDIVFVQVYLEGEFPAGFKRLRNATREILDEFRAYSNNIQYEFINPSDVEKGTNVEETYRMLVEKGLSPTNVQFRTEDANSQQIIFPAAIVTYKGRERPVQLLKDQLGMGAESVINNSIQSLEFNLAAAINGLSKAIKPKIAFIDSYGCLDKNQVLDISLELSDFYNVLRVPLNHQLNSLEGVKTIIIAKPQQAFEEKDKFIIDQFIMNGGNVLWLIDPVFASMDSLQDTNETLGVSQYLNLDDMLFKYGVRLNSNLLMDIKAVPIPITTGYAGNRPQISLLPWYFFPMVTPISSHMVVKNLNAIKTEFVSSIDTVRADGVTKTMLLHTSPYTRVVRTPAHISLDVMKRQPDERL
ncbi:MAG: gliding motility-associated ABC transporter substrate-binding protein GldG, partial [Bacteroidales bacterium]|nr:gliding motility-associated ABC transporter substrate-binding protein GldG [Bacteroidales bacterium]